MRSPDADMFKADYNPLQIHLFIVFSREMVECFNEIKNDTDIRAVVFSASGKYFTAGKVLIIHLIMSL